MIARSRSLKLAALLLAAGAHGVLAVALMPEDQILIEQGSGGADVRLGNSFADFVQGVEQVEPTEELAEDTPEELPEEQPDTLQDTPEPEPLEPEQPEPVETPPEQTALAQPRPAPMPEMQKPEVTAVAPAKAAILAPVQAVMAPDPQALALAPMMPELTELQPDTPSEPLPVPQEPLPEVTPETLTASEPETTAVARSLRPKTRSARIEAEHKPQPKPKPKPKSKAKPKPKPKPKAKPTKPNKKVVPSKPKKKSGNADQNAAKGDAGGSKTGKSMSQGNGKKKQSGNANTSNYEGKLVRCIQRKARVAAGGKRPPRVAITISSGGRVTSASLLSSSGSPRLDREVIKALRRVRACPKPPAGAKLRYSFRVR